MKPLLSLDQGEARHRVLSLYKAWYRQIPFMLRHYDLPVSQATAYKTLRAKFDQHRGVKDIRVIDMLVIKGQQDLKEVGIHRRRLDTLVSPPLKSSPKVLALKFKLESGMERCIL